MSTSLTYTGGKSSGLRERMLGRYRLIALLGEGGMARVFLALMKGPAGFNKLLVVKSMREDLVDPDFVRMFMHEARLAAQLNHSNVVQTYEVGEHEGRYFIAMEYLEGQCLRAVQRRLAPKRIPLATQLRVISDVARGLHHAHTLKSFDGTPLHIVHRDVSPQNVFITYEGLVKLLDFGIAKAEGGQDLTRAGVIKGKVDYMAPEQLRGDVIDQRADIFPLGVMLWEAIVGRRFSGGAEVADVTKIHNRVLGMEPRLREAAPSTPMRLVEICDKALSVDPAGRQASAEELAEELQDFLADTGRGSDPRHLAEIMGKLFESERAEIRALIDEQTRLANDEVPEDSGSLPSLPAVRRVEISGSTSGERAGTSSVQKAVRSAVLQSSETNVDVLPSRSRGIPLAIALLAAALGMGAYFGARNSAETPALPEARAAAEATLPANIGAPALPEPRAETAPDAPVAPSTVLVRISVDPPESEAHLDGRAIDLPFEARFPVDTATHRLEVEAPGHIAELRTLSFAEDADLHIELERRSRPVRRRATRGGASRTASTSTMAPTESASTMQETSARPSRRLSIDTEDPYQ
jgi:serine/threonine-protein kinase